MRCELWRRRFVSGFLCIGLLVVPILGQTQTTKKAHRVAILGNEKHPLWQAFLRGMRDQGYEHPRDFVVVSRSPAGKTDQLPALANELAGLKPDVIMTAGVQGTRAAMQATATIPIVMAVSAHPDKVGLVKSLARPGGNVTGLTSFAAVLQGKQLELLKEIAPNVTRVALLFNSKNPVEPIGLKQLQAAAPAAGVAILPADVPNPDELASTFSGILTSGAHALVVHANPVNIRGAKPIIQFGLKNKIPTIFGSSAFVAKGGLMAYAPNLPDLFRQSATYVVKILNGAKPANLPVEEPSKFELVINAKTAKSLGLTIPPSIMLRADRVIE